MQGDSEHVFPLWRPHVALGMEDPRAALARQMKFESSMARYGRYDVTSDGFRNMSRAEFLTRLFALDALLCEENAMTKLGEH